MTAHDPDAYPAKGVTRRVVLGTSAGAAAASIWPASTTVEAQPVPALPEPRGGVSVATSVNGKAVALDIDPRASLLDMLRERVVLTGTKKGCDHGQCGACTVFLDGRTVVSCLTLAAKCNGKEVTTVEGLGEGRELHPMQAAFIRHDALQCGYCTPGQIMSAVACVQRKHAADKASIREFMSGNICRCGAYPGIVSAIEDVATTSREG